MTPDGFILYTLLVACAVAPVTLGFAHDPNKKPKHRRIYNTIGWSAFTVALVLLTLIGLIGWW